MAKLYFEKLTKLVADLVIEDEVECELEVKHFFSGAALYANDKICASWSPGGLAFKLTKLEANNFIESGVAKPLKYFDKGRIKEGYAMFESPESADNDQWKAFFIKAVNYSEIE